MNIDYLSKQILDEMKNYTDNVIKEINKSSDKISRKAVKAVKEASPKRTGEYATGWQSTILESSSMFFNAKVIHNENKKRRITHLLENGHVGRDGKRVKAIPHIKSVEEMAKNEFNEAVERIIKNG